MFEEMRISHLGWTRRALTPSPSPNNGRMGLFTDKKGRFWSAFLPLSYYWERGIKGVRAESHVRWEILEEIAEPTVLEAYGGFMGGASKWNRHVEACSEGFSPPDGAKQPG